MDQYIRKISIVPKVSCFEKKLRKDCSAKELLEEFIKLLYDTGYTQTEINNALGTRKQIKDLHVEIGKLESYIDELEYKIKSSRQKRR